MKKQDELTYSAFEGHNLLVTGSLEHVAIKVQKKQKSPPQVSILIFSDSTGKEMDLDLRGSEDEMLERLKVYISKYESDNSSGPGRPKLGVIAREVSLLPRHWEWLATQPGGASATLRRLIDDYRKNASQTDVLRLSQERTYKFMTSLAGNLPNYEEAIRVLYAKDKKSFSKFIKDWPKDIQEYIMKLSKDAWKV